MQDNLATRPSGSSSGSRLRRKASSLSKRRKAWLVVRKSTCQKSLIHQLHSSRSFRTPKLHSLLRFITVAPALGPSRPCWRIGSRQLSLSRKSQGQGTYVWPDTGLMMILPYRAVFSLVLGPSPLRSPCPQLVGGEGHWRTW